MVRRHNTRRRRRLHGKPKNFGPESQSRLDTARVDRDQRHESRRIEQTDGRRFGAATFVRPERRRRVHRQKRTIADSEVFGQLHLSGFDSPRRFADGIGRAADSGLSHDHLEKRVDFFGRHSGKYQNYKFLAVN